MATDADCMTAMGGTDETTAAKKAEDTPICLSRFAAPLTAEFTISRTARYAKDPTAYLIDALGQATVDERKSLLSIPKEVNKDVYGTGSHKQGFEQHIATLLGKAYGLFFFTGVQAQLSALKIYCERKGKNKVAWHVTSHLESAEFRSFETLYGLERTLLGSDERANPTVAEIKSVLSLPEAERPAVIVLEVPNRNFGCDSYTWAELEEISQACRASGVFFHCDGARVWDIEPYYHETAGKTFSDIANLFDSMYVSFYKGLGGVTGSVLVHDDESFMHEAKIWRRRAGGNPFTIMYEVIDCERGFNENIGTFAAKWKKMVDVVDQVKAATAKFKTADGRPVLSTMPEKPISDQIHMLFEGHTEDELSAARDKVQEKLGIRVFERLKPKHTLDSMPPTGQPMEEAKTNGVQPKSDDRSHSMEWGVSYMTVDLGTEVFVKGYVGLCEELASAAQPS